MKQTVTLGLLALGFAVVLVIVAGEADRSEWEIADAPRRMAPTRPLENRSDELTAPADDVLAVASDEDTGAGDRVSLPDPLDGVVQYLRAANPALYGSLSASDARGLKQVDLTAHIVSDDDVQRLLELPSLASVRVDGKTTLYSKSQRSLMTLRRRGIQIIGYSRIAK